MVTYYYSRKVYTEEDARINERNQEMQ